MRTPLALSVLVAALPASRAYADQVTIPASRDNTLYAESGAESNGAGHSFFAGVAGNGSMRRGLIAFDVAAAIPAGATITGVQMVLYMSMTHAGPVTIELHRLTSSWGEGTSDAPSGEGGGTTAMLNDATWTRRFYDTIAWTTAGGDYDAAASASLVVNGFGSYAFGTSAGMVADVQSWLDLPAGSDGWILINTTVGGVTAKRFSSRTNFTVSLQPKLIVDYTPPPYTLYCFGDGSGTACPCGNAGISSNGCASSLNGNGAHIAAFGTPSIASDSMLLFAHGMPDASALYFQGTAKQNGGAGAVYGDGLRCAGGTVIRLGLKTNVGGASSFPSGGDPSISVRGGITAAGTARQYQCWYRNSAAFCTAATFNLTNGVQAIFVP